MLTDLGSPRIARVVVAALFAVLLALSLASIGEFWRNRPRGDGLILKNGQLVGGDFVSFYVAGQIFNTERGSLYDLPRQRELQQPYAGAGQAGDAAVLPFVYPPLVAAVLSVYATLPFLDAFYAWVATALALSFGALLLVLREVAPQLTWRQIPLVTVAFVGFLPYSMNTLMSGQFAWVGICVFSLTFLCLRAKHPLLAGAVFALSYYKPPLFVVALICLLLTQSRRFAAGFVLGAALLVALSLALVGLDGCLTYLFVASKYTYGQEFFPGFTLPPGQGAGVYGALVQFGLPLWQSASIFGGVIAAFVAVIVRLHRGITDDAGHIAFYALIVVASVGLSVQCIRYDVAILLVPFCILFSALSSMNLISRVATWALVTAFYFEFTARFVHVAGGIYNASSLLFASLIVVLCADLHHRRQRTARRAE